MSAQNLTQQLFEINAVRFGSFTLKSGIISPIYLDLRLTVSYPKLLTDIAEALYAPMRACEFDLLCGVPYTALPFATAISIAHNIPMVMRRKERKDYGTAKLIEGVFQKGSRCIIIEDVITSGSSVFETAKALSDEGLEVTDAIVLVDREQGGVAALAKQGIRVHSILKLSTIVKSLVALGKIDKTLEKNVGDFLLANQIN